MVWGAQQASNYYKVTSALSKSTPHQILLFQRDHRVGNKLNVPKYFKQINLVEKYVWNNSTKFYTYLLSKHVIYRPLSTVRGRDEPNEAPILKDLTVKCIEKRTYTNNYFIGSYYQEGSRSCLFGLTIQSTLVHIWPCSCALVDRINSVPTIVLIF